MKWSVIGVVGLHILGSLSPFVTGLAFHSSPALGCVGLLVSALFLTAVLSRALRVDEDCEMLMSALGAPLLDDDEETLPNAVMPITVTEPVTGVKHKTIANAPPRVVTWHGKRGKS